MKKTGKDSPVIILFLLMIVFSCNKNDDSFHDFAPGLAGTWRFVKGTDPEKYLVINKDNTCSVLSSDAQGIRDKSDAIIMVTGNQVMIDNSDPNVYPNMNIYNYKVKGDTLKLESPEKNIFLVKNKDSNASDSWIKTAVADVRYKAPVPEPTDIAFDGSSIWYGNGYISHYLYSVDPLNGKMDSLFIDQYAWSAEADSTNLWVGNNGSDNVTLISKSDGTEIAASTAMGAWIYGIALDNDHLWCYSNNERTLYKYLIRDNSVSLSTKVAGNWAGLATANNFLYVAANGKLHKCSTEPLAGIDSYELKGYYIFGVAFDGSSVWVSAYLLPDKWPEIIKLSGMD